MFCWKLLDSEKGSKAKNRFTVPANLTKWFKWEEYSVLSSSFCILLIILHPTQSTHTTIFHIYIHNIAILVCVCVWVTGRSINIYVYICVCVFKSCTNITVKKGHTKSLLNINRHNRAVLLPVKYLEDLKVFVIFTQIGICFVKHEICVYCYLINFVTIWD